MMRTPFSTRHHLTTAFAPSAPDISTRPLAPLRMLLSGAGVCLKLVLVVVAVSLVAVFFLIRIVADALTPAPR